ncbi:MULTISPECIES: ShlB/FhaC/HecB family hemolysin secretion/activation protein [Pasteurellaceae]|uniref:ShlB/FhaC/HecB family hemolysin secretion/activation protein n=1 Tax=Pasteurella atlantica TaxID=2827233 RepID=A0AAW8CNP1_9PAST|nr:ShlB/FhaC/HecB family hemolysin secretion/activation protein [Pasteurella atlantica]MBR0573025.1 ShlB/FhaC/HecB family hemolysin secretion/activation protein [Pasteurella atlantica]MDP8038848.1 ShlB/FhaC/HecB family hemolysin secretion/activation protein [Pasteurella atlantica]MDP8041043.1 ShlB/FhaC/HecB family hemolysin secretion/activation protein [Pasteurella atlantica]MDP8043179.1 ShlB/FhaC/HecB family hemolysin secretion/activation protein [Pasteurella atlantica]MDP8045265.1 ShlB/FhaC/
MKVGNLFNTALFLIAFSLVTDAYAKNINEINQTQYQQFKQHIEQLTAQKSRPFTPLKQEIQTNIDKIVENETPCFIINELQIKTPNDARSTFIDSISHLRKGKYSIIGQCIGLQGLNQISRSIQNKLLEQGYITSQAIIQSQDLTTGNLVITIIPGRLNNILMSNHSTKKVTTYNALTLKSGDIINLRDIETSLENLRLPQSANVNIQVIPSINENSDPDNGISDFILNYKRTFPLHFNVNIDDSGSKDTGKYKATFSSVVDNPLNINDVLDLSYSHTIEQWNHTQTKSNSSNFYVGYTLPIKNWMLSFSHSNHNFHQTLIGLNNDIVYSGKTIQEQVELQRILYRNSELKTSMTLGGYYKKSQNFFDDEEIEVQRRKSFAWSFGLQHQYQTKLGDIKFGIKYQHGTGAFSAIPAPESYVSNVESKPSIWSINASWQYPFQLLNQPYQYKINIFGQYSRHHLIPQDLLSIGGRYSVRGFDGEYSLSGEKGLVVQQELGRLVRLSSIKNITLMPYLTLDYGFVSGESTRHLAGKSLAGSTLGVKIFGSHLSLDAFIGYGIKAPKKIKKDLVTGFKVSIFY